MVAFALSYANIFMDDLEETLLSNAKVKPKYWVTLKRQCSALPKSSQNITIDDISDRKL